MNVDIRNLMQRPWVAPAAAGVVGFAAGAVAGHLYEKRKEEAEGEVIVIDMEEVRKDLDESIARVEERDEELEAEIEATKRRHPATPLVEPPELTIVPDEEEVMEEEIEIIEEQEEEPIVNIFANGKPDNWDWEKELALRTDDSPFILHEEEFMANDEDSLPQQTLTYYEGDNIMADSADTPLYGWDNIVGPLRFGHGSSDQNSFYVRNPNLKGEYEILRDPGKFAEIVLGLEADNEQERAELKHSRQLRFRMDD